MYTLYNPSVPLVTDPGFIEILSADGKRSPSPMDTHKSVEITGAIPTFQLQTNSFILDAC